MLKKSFFTTLIANCEEQQLEKHFFRKWDTVLDYAHDHNIYVFVSGRYTISVVSALGTWHEIGELQSPNIIGEWVFFGTFRKQVRIRCDEEWYIYTLDEKVISSICKKHPLFRENLMRACLAVANERLSEANVERILAYGLSDALESNSFGTIPKLLSTLRDTFSLEDVLWIERHEVLQDIFAIRYRASLDNNLVNERVADIQKDHEPYMRENWLWDGYFHVFPFISSGECFGYLVYQSEDSHLAGYISRITVDIIPNCIRIIESGWKSKRNE